MKRSFHHIKSHSFQGKRFKIVWRVVDKANDGKCDPPDNVNKKIFIGPNLPEDELLETAVHESLHACLFCIDEDHAAQAAADIAKFLRRMGFGLVDRQV